MSEISDFIVSALDASILVSPRDHGLSVDEIIEIGGRVGFRRGEIVDTINKSQIPRNWAASRICYEGRGARKLSTDFNHEMEPEHRDFASFEFVRAELQRLAAEFGESEAHISRDVLVERGVQKGMKRNALEVATTVTVLDEIFEEKDGVIRHARGRLNWVLPSKQMESRHLLKGWKSADRWMGRVYTIVQDVISRRTDGRPVAANPLDAFEDQLRSLGHERFRAWWVQKRQELLTLEPTLYPVSVTVISAALAEAALSFVVPRAKAVGLMKLVDPAKPREWRFVNLIKGAKSSDPAVIPILDERAAQRCLDLNDARQRIHAGFLIDSAQTGPIPDLKPEQARDALQTTDLLVRKILDWLAQQLPSGA